LKFNSNFVYFDMITFKKATLKEIDFIIETIIESEKSGTDRFSYSTLLDLSEQEVINIIKDNGREY